MSQCRKYPLAPMRHFGPVSQSNYLIRAVVLVLLGSPRFSPVNEGFLQFRLRSTTYFPVARRCNPVNEKSMGYWGAKVAFDYGHQFADMNADRRAADEVQAGSSGSELQATRALTRL